MADIALLVVEEFERTTKKKMQQGRGGSLQPLAGAGERDASAPKISQWRSWATVVAPIPKEPTVALGLAGADGFFSA
ncbi:unnamed protein product [Alopecurus aequalis]